jgi:hypothetical protein
MRVGLLLFGGKNIEELIRDIDLLNGRVPLRGINHPVGDSSPSTGVKKPVYPKDATFRM